MIALASVAHAGAWTRELGHGYTRAGLDLSWTAQFVGPLGEEGGRYRAEQVTGYAEVGVGPRAWPMQVGVGVPVIAGHHTTTVTTVVGPLDVRASSTRPGDLRLVPQVALHPDLPVALAFEVKWPLYANDGVGGDVGPHELFPKPGDGQLDLAPLLWAGASKGAWFAEGMAGWRHRTERFVHFTTDATFSDAWLLTAKGGARWGRALPVAQVDVTRSLRADDTSREAVTTSLTALVDVVRDHVALEPRAAADLWARNTSRGWSLGLGLSARR